MTDRDRIVIIVNSLGHSKKVYAELKKQDLLSAIPDVHQNFGNNLFDYVYPEQIKTCTIGNICRFVSLAVGYRYCGPAKTCECARQSVADKVSSTKSQYTDQQRDEILSKRQDTVQEKYGVSNVSQSNAVKERMRQTFVENYGVDNPNKDCNVRAKTKATCIEKYGVDNPAKHKDVQKKTRATNIRKHGNASHTQNHFTDDLRNILSCKVNLENALVNASGNYLAQLHGVCEGVIYRKMHEFDLLHYKNTTSGPEQKVKLVLDEQGIEYIQNDRTMLAPYELDFYIPEHNLAIEINGIYWHSTASPANRDKNYHFDKWKKCRALGITLISYTDADVINNIEMIINKVSYLTNKSTRIVGARKCTIGPVSSADEFALLEEHHIQGKLNARSGVLGAYHDNNLVAVINWATRKKYLEITRYCCDNQASYPGLFSRMTKAMQKKTEYTGDIVSFSNNDHSNGNVYKQAGFAEDKILGPAYWYTRDFVTLENRQKYMKSKIAARFGIDMTDKTEWQAMQELGFHRYYDSGKIRWTLT